MTDIDETNEPAANTLCRACGLCCTGHLFVWVRLKVTELDHAQALGLNVIRSDPRQRGFTQPCPLWQGQCTIYTSLDYPHVCGSYQCKLLKEVINEDFPIADALSIIEQAKGLIHEVESLLPVSTSHNFRERLVTYLEGTPGQENTVLELRKKAASLLAYYETVFGVKDLIENPDEQ